MLYSCTYMATVGFKGLSLPKLVFVLPFGILQCDGQTGEGVYLLLCFAELMQAKKELLIKLSEVLKQSIKLKVS